MISLEVLEDLIDVLEKRKQIFVSKPYTYEFTKEDEINYELLILYNKKEKLIREEYNEIRNLNINELKTLRRELKINKIT